MLDCSSERELLMVLRTASTQHPALTAPDSNDILISLDRTHMVDRVHSMLLQHSEVHRDHKVLPTPAVSRAKGALIHM